MLEKQAIPNLKALIVAILNPEDWGHGFVIDLPSPLFMKNVLFTRRGHGKLLMLPHSCPSGFIMSTIRGLK